MHTEILRTGLAALMTLSFLGAPVPAEEPNADQPAVAAAAQGAFGIPVHGSFSVRYRGRWTDKDTEDHDVFSTLGLDIGDAGRQRVTFHMLGRVAGDLDGERDTEGLFVFDSIEDTYGSSINAQLYHAYFDVHETGLLETVRLGRQSVIDTPEVAYFDGARIETEEFGPLQARVGAYGGISVHLFESSPDDDILYGGFLQARPWTGGKIRGDFMHAEDTKRFTGSRREDDLFGLSVWQTLCPYAQVHAAYTWLDDDDRDVLGRLNVNVPRFDLRTQLSYYRQLETQNEFAIEFDPFYTSNFSLFPYEQVRWLVSKGFGENFWVEGGIDARRLEDADDVNIYNRAFDRYHLTLSTADLPIEGLSLSLTGELWESPARDVDSFGADVTHQCTDRLKASLGTYYSLYKYDFLNSTEKDDVQTYYARVVYKLTDALKADVRYEFEDDDFERYHQVRIGLQWSF